MVDVIPSLKGRAIQCAHDAVAACRDELTARRRADPAMAHFERAMMLARMAVWCAHLVAWANGGSTTRDEVKQILGGWVEIDCDGTGFE